MKEKIVNFLKDKFNIALIIIQVVAITCYFLSAFTYVLAILFFVFEGVFFIVLGTKLVLNVRKLKSNEEMILQMPYTETQKADLIKTGKKVAKNNKFIGIILICLGIILLFSGFSFIF